MFNQTLVLVWAQESGQIAARQPRKIGSQWSGARCRDLVPWCRVAWWTEDLWGSDDQTHEKYHTFRGIKHAEINGKAYFWGLCKGISPQNMAKHMVLTYLHQLDPEIPIDERSSENSFGGTGTKVFNKERNCREPNEHLDAWPIKTRN